MTFTAYFLIAILTGLLVYFFVLFMRFQKQKEKLKQDNRHLQKENYELINQIHALELENSKFRLNPHLFKNTLNSIQGYAFRTHQALEKLGGVLDYILYDSNVQYTTIGDELAFVQNFIELNKIKLSPLFDLKFKVKADDANPYYKQHLLSPLITAYFIENAFKHADLQSPDAFISIYFELWEDEFTFTVSNKINKAPIFNSKGGLGKENMKKRLDILYGKSCKLNYTTEDDIYTAHLKIKLGDVKSKVHHP